MGRQLWARLDASPSMTAGAGTPPSSSQLIAAGIDMRNNAGRLGHADAGFTRRLICRSGPRHTGDVLLDLPKGAGTAVSERFDPAPTALTAALWGVDEGEGSYGRVTSLVLLTFRVFARSVP